MATAMGWFALSAVSLGSYLLGSALGNVELGLAVNLLSGGFILALMGAGHAARPQK